MIEPHDIRGLLLDLDGTVYEGRTLVPGAVEAISDLRAAGTGLLFTTNTSRKSRRDVVASLAGMGLYIEPEEVFTAPVASAEWLRSRGIERLELLLPESTHADFSDFRIDSPEPEAVVVGDLGPGFTFETLNRAFRCLRAGAFLVALHKNRFWVPEKEPVLDAGPFVAALEYGAGVEATLVGKPSPAFFATAAERLGLSAGELAVVGDDAESDILGARRGGLASIQVRTGKFALQREAFPGSPGGATWTIDSIAELPGLLRKPASHA